VSALDLPSWQHRPTAQGDPDSGYQPQLTARIRLLPINFFISYLNLTVLLFAFGPWSYPIEDPTLLYLFLAAAHTALYLGYLTTVFRDPRDYRGHWKVEHLLLASVILSLLVLFPTAAYETGSVIPDVRSAIANPGYVYLMSYAARREQAGLISYVRIFLAPLLALLLPLTIFYWQRLTLRLRIVAVCLILGAIAMFVAKGTNKGVFDPVIVAPWLLLGAHTAGYQKLKRRHVAMAVVVGVSALALAAAFFVATQATRWGSCSVYSALSPLAPHVVPDQDNFMIRNLPRQAKVAVLGVNRYLATGYYALYLSLQEPFVPMWGVGNSFFLFRQAARITGRDEIMDMPYPLRIEKYGWDAYGLWSSIYPWIASDVSFPGTILVVFFIGRLFALSWLDTLRGSNPFAVATFAKFLIMLYYFPGNNQCLQTGEELTAFWTILALWLITRRKQIRGATRQ